MSIFTRILRTVGKKIADFFRMLFWLTLHYDIVRDRETRRTLGLRTKKRSVNRNGKGNVNVIFENVTEKKGCGYKCCRPLSGFKWRLFSFILTAAYIYILTFVYDKTILGNPRDPASNLKWMECRKEFHTFLSSLWIIKLLRNDHTPEIIRITKFCTKIMFIQLIMYATVVVIYINALAQSYFMFCKYKTKRHAFRFSEKAVLCLKDKSLWLILQIGDMKNVEVIQAKLTATIIRREVNGYGEVFHLHQKDLRLGPQHGEPQEHLVWSKTVVHKITSDSPLYRLSPEDLYNDKFEIVVTLKGVTIPTGKIIKKTATYHPNEILWGHHFQPLITIEEHTEECQADMDFLNATFPVQTPLCSAFIIDRVFAFLDSLQYGEDSEELYFFGTARTPQEYDEVYETQMLEIEKKMNRATFYLLGRVGDEVTAARFWLKELWRLDDEKLFIKGYLKHMEMKQNDEMIVRYMSAADIEEEKAIVDTFMERWKYMDEEESIIFECLSELKNLQQNKKYFRFENENYIYVAQETPAKGQDCIIEMPES